MNLKDTLETYGSPTIGFPSEETYSKLHEISPDLEELWQDLVYRPVRSMKAPLFHEATDKKGYFIAIPEQYVPYVQAMFASRYSKKLSIRESKEKLEALGYTISSDGQISNIWNRCETRLKLKDKTKKEVKAVQARKAIAEARGKTKINPLTEKRSKQLEEARKISQEKRLLAKLKKEEQLAKRRLAKAAKKTGRTAKDIKSTKEEREAALGQVKEEIKASGKKVLYEPTPKQAEFHAADEDIVLYGGAAGGGKSYAMLVDVLRYCQHDGYRGLLIRRTSPMLKELVSVSRSLYPKAFPGAKFNKSENVWSFPSGATIQFGYLDREEDLENYQGLPYSYIGFDEIQHQRSDAGFIYLLSRLRNANPEIKCYIRASANPGGSPWVKELFIDSAPANTRFYKNGLSYRFIPAKLEDNPYLDTPVGDEEMSPYRKMLMALPEVQRKQLLEGDWMVGEDAMFAFAEGVHTTKELPPLHWSVVNALDYGYKDPAAALWGAVCPKTGQIIIYSELECLEHDHVTWGRAVLSHEGYMPQGVDRIIDDSVFRKAGHVGPGVREQLSKIGLQPRPADRQREPGWNQVYQRLLINPDTGAPQLLVHESCVKLIEQLLTARINPKKPDDIDDKRIKSKGRTHHWDLLDALRYLLMSRPQALTIQERGMRHKTSAQGFARYHGYFS
tara:strand:- start:85 stop:2106 length:2022 start_codon:yes stop_codon:yes gene_type:complete